MELGVHVLINRAEEATVHRTPLLIGGIPTSPEDYATYGAEFFQEYEKSGAFKLLIAHYPGLYYGDLAEGAVDLGICGHYHGGQFRLPLLGGLYHGDTGLFPKYSGGLYRLAKGTLFVSRGNQQPAGASHHRHQRPAGGRFALRLDKGGTARCF